MIFLSPNYYLIHYEFIGINLWGCMGDDNFLVFPKAKKKRVRVGQTISKRPNGIKLSNVYFLTLKILKQVGKAWAKFLHCLGTVLRIFESISRTYWLFRPTQTYPPPWYLFIWGRLWVRSYTFYVVWGKDSWAEEVIFQDQHFRQSIMPKKHSRKC